MTASDLDDLPWDEIQQISKEGIFEEVFKKIPKARFRVAAKDENRSALMESAYKSLKKTNPKATYGQAALLTDIMQHYAKKVIEDKQ